MKILALDTSGKLCSVAVAEDGKILNQISSVSEKEHSQILMPNIKKLLKSLKFKLDDIDLLSCSRGPGSFTGIRVGMATVKALSDAKNIPIAGVDTLKAQAYSVIMKKGRNECKILSLIDARNENVYFAVYRIHNGNLSLFKNAEIRNISDVVEYVDFEDPLYIVGDSYFEKIDPLFKAKYAKQYAQGRKTENYEYITDLPPLAEAIAMCAQDKYEVGDYRRFKYAFPNVFKKTSSTKTKRRGK